MDENSPAVLERPLTPAKCHQIKVAFHLPLWSNPNPGNGGRKTNLRAQISSALNEIAEKVSRNNSFDGYWQRGGEGVYRMLDGTSVTDPYLRYFIVLDPPWEDKLYQLEQILERFRCATAQESIYLEIQYSVELRLVGMHNLPRSDDA